MKEEHFMQIHSFWWVIIIIELFTILLSYAENNEVYGIDYVGEL